MSLISGAAKTGIHTVMDVVLQVYADWRDSRTIRLGAGVAYYSLFALVPFLAFFAITASWIFGQGDVESFLSERFAAVGIDDPEGAAAALAGEIDQRSTGSSLGLIGLGSLVFAASLVFLALADAIKMIWDAPVKVGLKNTLRRRLVSFLMMLCTSALIAVGFVITAISGAAQALVPGQYAFLEDLAQLLSSIASSGALALLFVLLFRFMPPVRVPWVAAFIAATATALAMVAGTALAGWYLREYGGASLSGAYGAVLAFLTWVFYVVQILLIGLHLAKVLTPGQD